MAIKVIQDARFILYVATVSMLTLRFEPNVFIIAKHY